MSLAFDEPKLVALHSNSYLQACSTSAKKLLILYAKQSMENHRGPTPDEIVPLS